MPATPSPHPAPRTTPHLRALLLAAGAGVLVACADTPPTAPAPRPDAGTPGVPQPAPPAPPAPADTAPTPPAPADSAPPPPAPADSVSPPPAPSPPAPSPLPPTPAPPTPAPPAPTPPAGVVPQGIVGEWTTGPAGLSPRDFWTAPHGMFLNRRASWITIEADGRYTWLEYLYQGMGSCVTQTWQEVRGTVAVDGPVDTVRYDPAAPEGWSTAGWRPLVVTPAAGRYKAHERCATDVLRDFDRPMTAQELGGLQRAHVVRLQASALHPGRVDLAVAYNHAYTNDTGQDWFQRVQ